MIARSFMLLITCGWMGLFAGAQQSPAATPVAVHAAMESMQIPSHGSLLNALVYVAAGPGPHPAVVLLHGFPGNERNLDLAQAMRRAGWDVLFFDYRGSWGTPGNFSFGHSVEDTAAAVAYLRDAANAQRLRIDPAHIVLLGHSMGGFMAVEEGADDPTIAAVGLISAADMAGRLAGASLLSPTQQADVVRRTAVALAQEGMAPLAGCTPEGLAQELLVNASRWQFGARAAALATRPVLVVTSNDGLARSNDALAQSLRGDHDTAVATTHFDTDHAYSDKRVQLETAVLHWLAGLSFAPPMK